MSKKRKGPTPGQYVYVSPDDVRAAMTPAGAWSRDTLAGWGVRWPPKQGWRYALEHGTWQAQKIPPRQFKPTAAARRKVREHVEYQKALRKEGAGAEFEEERCSKECQQHLHRPRANI